MLVEGRDLSSRQTQYVVKDMEIGQPINSKSNGCNAAAWGMHRELSWKSWPRLRAPMSFCRRKTQTGIRLKLSGYVA